MRVKYLKAYRGGLLSSLGSVDSTTSRRAYIENASYSNWILADAVVYCDAFFVRLDLVLFSSLIIMISVLSTEPFRAQGLNERVRGV